MKFEFVHEGETCLVYLGDECLAEVEDFNQDNYNPLCWLTDYLQIPVQWDMDPTAEDLMRAVKRDGHKVKNTIVSDE